jgi:hypothetical protein
MINTSRNSTCMLRYGMKSSGLPVDRQQNLEFEIGGPTVSTGVRTSRVTATKSRLFVHVVSITKRVVDIKLYIRICSSHCSYHLYHLSPHFLEFHVFDV